LGELKWDLFHFLHSEFQVQSHNSKRVLGIHNHSRRCFMSFTDGHEWLKLT
jgi:hypothetical protein